MINRPILDGKSADFNIDMLADQLKIVFQRVQVFVDATSAAQSVYVPDGDTQGDKDYHFVKTDSSANTVTIYPTGANLIQGAASLTLVTQGDSAWLGWDKATQTWWLL